MSTVKALFALLGKPRILKSLLSFHSKGYLADIGWFNAFESRQSVDQNGSPIPWVTYSFIDFIKDRITNSHSIFEYGSGNSTKFYADRAKYVKSVEHDKTWFERIKGTNPSNAEILYCALNTNGAYSRMSVNSDICFDIIIVDGRDRVNCCKQAVEALTDHGVIVLDDSERESYAEAIGFLKERGFRQLVFSGISPGLFYYKSTSIFYKTNNCLGI